MRNKQKITVDLEIVELSKKGNGIGYFKDKNNNLKKIEVPFTLPKDFVKATLTRKKGSSYFAKVEEYIQKSPLRQTPRCLHFGVCGGCKLQHLNEEEQAKIKESSVLNYFKDLINQEVTFYPIIKAKEPYAYRNKMEFTFSSDKEKNKYLGLIINESRGKVLNLTECHLTNRWFIEALNVVKKWWETSDLEAYHPLKDTGSLRTLTLRESMTTKDRLVMLTVSGNPDFALHRHHIESFVKHLKESIQPSCQEATLSIFLRIQQVAKGVETSFFEMHLHGMDHIKEKLHIKPSDHLPEEELIFTISPQAFFQPNTKQAEILYSKALQLGEISKNDIVYDLYCGTGTLGICIAKYAKTVVGVEISREASLDARTNVKNNQLDNVIIYTGDVSKILKEKELPKPNVVLVDPPRVGLEPAALKEIIQLNPEKIIYISCNPETQSYNVQDFINAGYRLVAIQPVDQFPQTAHIENIVILKR